MARQLPIGVLVSGGGTNLQAIIDAIEAKRLEAAIKLVLSNKVDAYGLVRAKNHGIATEILDHRKYPSRETYDEAVVDLLRAHGVELVVLAGFMRIVGADFVQRFDGRLVNIHPSLLPAFPGLHTHRRALEAGCKVAGATVHFVTGELDHGPIIAQAVVPVLAGDSEDDLGARVLVQEHRLYPLAIGWLVAGELQREGELVRHRTGASQLLTGIGDLQPSVRSV